MRLFRNNNSAHFLKHVSRVKVRARMTLFPQDLVAINEVILKFTGEIYASIQVRATKDVCMSRLHWIFKPLPKCRIAWEPWTGQSKKLIEKVHLLKYCSAWSRPWSNAEFLVWSLTANLGCLDLVSDNYGYQFICLVRTWRIKISFDYMAKYAPRMRDCWGSWMNMMLICRRQVLAGACNFDTSTI